MLLKFFSRGTGKGKTAVEYLLRETDANGIRREPLPTLLRGNPEQIIDLIDSLDFKHKYNSGVISFAPEDAPTLAQEQALIDSFEKTAFAGLQPDRYSILWVKHCHTNSNRVELHFITPRVELTTGKSLNISPPGWGNYFRPWRDYWNYSQGWASPDDPARARTYHPDYHALIDAQNLRLSLEGKPINNREDYRKIITNYLEENIKLGQIQDSKDLRSLLQETGFTIARTGADYLTVYREDIGQKIRLKGGIYSESWRLGKGVTAEVRSGQEEDRSSLLARAREAEEQLSQRTSERAEYHHSRYGNIQAENHRPTEMVSVVARSNTYQPLPDFLRHELGDDALSNQPTTRNPNTEENKRNTQEQKLASRTLRNRTREISNSATQHQISNQLEVQQQALLKAVKEDDERIRKRVTANVLELCHSIRSGQEATSRTNRELNQTNSNLTRLNQQLEQQRRTVAESLSRHHERLRRIRMKREEELEKFKSQINLVEYATYQGYQLDKSKSSQNCIVLKDNVGDKILVGVDRTDNHYFYYSVKNERDSGSIIDFIQKRKNLNLGEVRKELRPWINSSYSPSYRAEKEPIPQPKPASKDRYKILVQFENFEAIAHHPYLAERGINQQTTSDPRFEGTLYTDGKGNVIFPHLDREGICGYEIRNQNFKGFSSGGTKGLWISRSFGEDLRLVICESPLDCLSYHQLYPDAQTRYFATGGTISELQKDLLTTAFEKIHAQGGQIIIATDRDEAGNKLALELAKIAPESSQISRSIPEHQKDWNEALVAQIAWERQQQEQQKRDRGRGFSR